MSRHTTGKLLVSHYCTETVMERLYPEKPSPNGVGSFRLRALASRCSIVERYAWRVRRAALVTYTPP